MDEYGGVRENRVLGQFLTGGTPMSFGFRAKDSGLRLYSDPALRISAILHYFIVLLILYFSNSQDAV